MPNKVKVKRTYTSGVTPTTAELGPHEFAVNWADGIVFVKAADGSVQSVTLGGGGGGSSGGGSANIVEASTAAGFPATGASSTLYVSTDASRAYRWDASGVYVEIGTAGGTGTDADLRALFTPAAPTSVTATGGNAQATVSWTAPSVLAQTPITDYTVQFSSNSGTSWTAFTRAASTATSGVVVTGLTNGTAYVFRVAAVNALGTGAYSTASSAVTPAAAPSVPVTYANKYGSFAHSVTGTTTVTATLTGTGFASADTRLWLLIGATGTLSYTVTASSQAGADGGRLYITSSSPSNHGSSYESPDVASLSGLTNVSGAVTGTQASTGTLSVTAGQYLVLRYAKDSEDSDLNDRITAVLSIS
jgi:titin